MDVEEKSKTDLNLQDFSVTKTTGLFCPPTTYNALKSACLSHMNTICTFCIIHCFLIEVDESFDDIMCKSRDGVNDDDGDAPEFITPTKSISAPPVLGIVYENLSPKSWTYDYPSLPEGMRIPVPPNRTMHDKHVKKVNHFLAEMEKKPETLKMAVGLRREVDEILNDRMDNRACEILA